MTVFYFNIFWIIVMAKLHHYSSLQSCDHPEIIDMLICCSRISVENMIFFFFVVEKHLFTGFFDKQKIKKNSILS